MTIQDLEHEVELHRLFVERKTYTAEVLVGHKLITAVEQGLNALEYGREQGWLWDEFFSEEQPDGSPYWGWRYRLTDEGRARLFNRTK